MPEPTDNSREKLETMVANFLESIGNLQAIEQSDLNEVAHAVEYIGHRLNDETRAAQLRGYLLVAKAILDRAMSVNI